MIPEYEIVAIEFFPRDSSGMGGKSPSETTITIFISPEIDIEDRREDIKTYILENVNYFPADYVSVEITQRK